MNCRVQSLNYAVLVQNMAVFVSVSLNAGLSVFFTAYVPNYACSVTTPCFSAVIY